MDNQIFYSYCYKDVTPENPYQLVLVKDIYNTGEIIPPENAKLFSELVQMLFYGNSRTQEEATLFDQEKCLQYHYLSFKYNKKDFLKYTRMMYLAWYGEVRPTPLVQTINEVIMAWFEKWEGTSQIFDHDLRIDLLVNKEESERMDVPIGTSYNTHIAATTLDEAYERLQRYSGPWYCDILIKDFNKKYASPNAHILKDELKQINHFISEAEQRSISDAFKAEDQNSHNEYLRIIHGYYSNHWCDYILTGESSQVYGKYVLYREWLENRLNNFADSLSENGGVRGSFEDSRLAGMSIEKILKEGEGRYIEFKSTFLMDVRTNLENKSLTHSVLKTIAAFLNSDGGILIVGVDDESNILGLDLDFSLQKKQPAKDSLKTWFDNKVHSVFGSDIHQYLNMDFHNLEEKIVCSIIVKRKALHPIIIKTERNEEALYIRRQASTVSLSISETAKYCLTNWTGAVNKN